MAGTKQEHLSKCMKDAQPDVQGKEKTLKQVIKGKYLQETQCEHQFMVWNVFTLAVFVPLFICFRAFAKNKINLQEFLQI